MNSEMLLQQSLRTVQWDLWLSCVSPLCMTSLGQAFVAAWKPFLHAEAAEMRQQEIAELMAFRGQRGVVGLGGIVDLQDVLMQAHQGEALSGLQLREAASVLRSMVAVRRALMDVADMYPRLWSLMEPVPAAFAVVTHVERMLDEQGLLRDDASPRLRTLRRNIRDVQAEWSQRAASLFQDPSLSAAWQERYVTQREGRYVIPVRAEAQAALRGMVVDRSASGATVFVEPEALIELNNRHRLLVLEQKAEEHALFQQLTDALRDESALVLQTQAVMAHVDGVQALAQWADTQQWQLVPFDALAQRLVLRKARHPLLVVQGVDVIPHEIELEAGKGVVISGPNAGGKTACLHMLGLLVWMHQAGMPLPVAEGSQIPWFRHVWIQVGDQQSLQRNVSTFSSHVRALSEMAVHATPRDVVLVDEIAMGTDPEQGAALAQAYVEYLLDRGITTVVTTHAPSLKWLAAQTDRVRNASMGFDLNRMQPTYHLLWDVPGASETLPIAARYGLPPVVLERAEQLLRTESVHSERILRLLGEAHERVQQTQQQAEAALAEAHKREQQARVEQEAFHAERQRLRQQAYDETVRTLQQARREVEALRQQLRQRAEAHTVQETRAHLQQLADTVAQHAVQPAGSNTAGVQAQQIRVGQTVHIHSLRRPGIVLAVPEGDEVLLQVGSWKVQKPLADLELRLPAEHFPKERVVPASLPGASVASEKPILVRTASSTVDVRGQRVDEAFASIERFVDQALRQHTDVVFVIHGHGTGALKEAIRAQGLALPGVARVEAASPEDGGDGITLLYL